MSQQVFCRSCGNKIDEADQKCPYCGEFQPCARGKRDRFSAAILAFLVGGFGIHKFYLGQTKLGVLYLVFCWTLIPYVIGFVECIIFLFMTDAEFNEKYNRDA